MSFAVPGASNPRSVSTFREWRGNQHLMASANRQYNTPVKVYREDENGVRTLIREYWPKSS